ncbi:MAG TPA: hypothetical protein VI318_13875 [Baekduia sp.]
MASLVVVGASMLAVTSSASATTATVSSSNVTGTATTHAFLRAGSASLDCATATATATLTSRSGPLPIAISTNLQENFSSCTLVGIGGFTVACTNTSVLSVTSLTVSGVTQGTISNVRCTITVTGLCSADVTGSVTGSYNNLSSPLGQLTVNAAGQSLNVVNSTCGSLLPNGSATFTGPSGANLVYNISPRTTVTVA